MGSPSKAVIHILVFVLIPGSCRIVTKITTDSSSKARLQLALLPQPLFASGEMRTAEDKFQVRPSVSQFVIPLGATINMNGTALYQGIATIFLAQIFGVDIGVGGMLLVIVTAVGASIGAPATPGVGIVILAMILGTVGVPASGIALIMGVDRILDMSRTAVNVCGDLVAAKLMDRWVQTSVDVENAGAPQEVASGDASV